MNVYVETCIRAPLDRLWERTQDPAQHERWDLRFAEISYLPPSGPDEPQRFAYVTRLGLGLAIAGEGETVGERERPDGSRSSALSFWSRSPISLIEEGRGYWKYVPTPDGVRFMTAYDYQTRFGGAGRAVDRFLFRPLMGWATAWSFDRVRLWLEQDISPAMSLAAAVIHSIARVAIAFVFAYHGLVPKLLGQDADELAMLTSAGVPAAALDVVLVATGVTELVFAVVLLLSWHRRWPVVASALFAVVALAGVAATSPAYLAAAFNPVSLHVALLALVTIDLIVLPAVPDAGRCRRRPGGKTT